MSEQFRRCSTCKAPIAYGAVYYTCSVSTCNQKRLALFFCSVPCWDAHVPGARHRDAWAEKQVAPAGPAAESEGARASQEVDSARRRIVGRAVSPANPTPNEDDHTSADSDVLVVVSKLKAYIRARSAMNTSSGVAEVLSDHLRTIARDAIREAGKNGRKTVLDRDVMAVLGRRNDGG
jgi:histone H3/H4